MTDASVEVIFLSDSELSSLKLSTLETLSQRRESAKAQQSFINHLLSPAGLSTESRESLQTLFYSARDLRQRLLRVERHWKMLGPRAPLTVELASLTTTCLLESETLSTVLEQWRNRSISDERSLYIETWRQLSMLAEQRIADLTRHAATSTPASVS